MSLSIGKLGEKLAENYLQKQGYKILATHFTVRWGELDIVAQKGKTLVFVEVKTRKGFDWGLPEEAIRRRKKQALRRTAWYFQQRYPKIQISSFRFDVIAIVLNKNNKIVRFRHYQNVEI